LEKKKIELISRKKTKTNTEGEGKKRKRDQINETHQGKFTRRGEKFLAGSKEGEGLIGLRRCEDEGGGEEESSPGINISLSGRASELVKGAMPTGGDHIVLGISVAI